MNDLQVIALIGQPNVGKSSLFNRIARQRIAIVSEQAGTTRDIKKIEVKIIEKQAMVLDTGGIEETDHLIFSKVKEKALQTAKESDIVLFLVDGKNMPDDHDKKLFYEIQKLGKKIALVVNKIDNDKEKESLWEYFVFGVKEENIFPISVSHNRGTKNLFEWIEKQIPDEEIIDEIPSFEMQDDESLEEFLNPSEDINLKKIDEVNIHVSIIGKVNVGKSSIMNALLGAQRSVVSPIAGTTIDPVDESYEYKDKVITFVDTAGIRRRGKIEGIERFAFMRTNEMLEKGNMALVVIDASEPISDQDEKISGNIDKYGLGTIIVLNKWDEKSDTYEKLVEEIRFRFKFLYYAPIIAVSALTGRNIDTLKDTIIEVFDNYNRRISTSRLNEVINEGIRRHALPSPNGNRLRIYYSVQFETNPPTVALIMNKPNMLHFSYKRYLINHLRFREDFKGTPIRIVTRKKGERDDEELSQFDFLYDEDMVKVKSKE